MLRRYPAVRTFAHIAAAALLLAGCAQPPMGPTVQVMPGPAKSFGDFQNDQVLCKNFAASQVSGQAEQANQQAAGAAVLGTVLGAGLGAAIGSAGGAAGTGAAIGAGTGAVAGTAIGAQGTANAQYSIQQQYDNAYSQCMYSKGDQVPGYAPAAAAMPVSVSGPALIQAVQAQLIRLRYLSGGADGVQGPQTTSAIVNFERTNGLPVDGVASPALLARLQGMP
jgi:hypothetical protein